MLNFSLMSTYRLLAAVCAVAAVLALGLCYAPACGHGTAEDPIWHVVAIYLENEPRPAPIIPGNG